MKNGKYEQHDIGQWFDSEIFRPVEGFMYVGRNDTDKGPQKSDDFVFFVRRVDKHALIAFDLNNSVRLLPRFWCYLEQ